MTTLSTRRFLRTAALLDSSNEHERSTAARQASAMLREAGLDWTTVLKAGLTQMGLGEVATAPSFADGVSSGAASPFGDIFAEFFGSTIFNSGANTARPGHQAQPKPAADPIAEALKEKPHRFNRRKPTVAHVGGDKIPRFVHGTIKIIDNRRTDRTPALILAVCDSEVEYGPLIAFAKLDELEAMAERGQAVSGTLPGLAGGIG